MPSDQAPVYLVLTEVRFNPIMGLEAYIPTIQEQLRRNGFPDFKRRVSQQLVLPMNAAENVPASAPSFSNQISYVFADMQGQQVLTLSPHALSFQTTIYENFELFASSFLKALTIVHETIELNYFDRIGVRYLDAIVPYHPENFDDDVVPEVIGLKRLLHGQVVYSFNETLVKEGAEQLIARTYIQQGELAIPADLVGHAPKFANRFMAINGLHAILDNDAALEQREVFSLERIQTILQKVHTRASQSFKTMVKPEALKRWGIQ